MKTLKELEKILNEETCIGIINIYDDSLDEMARIGRIPQTKLEIHLEGSEGSIPHVHIQRINGQKRNGVCHLKLLINEYLRDKNDQMNILTTKERKALNEYMHGNLPGTDIQRWKSILGHWNEMNPGHVFNINEYECPDYTIIKEVAR